MGISTYLYVDVYGDAKNKHNFVRLKDSVRILHMRAALEHVFCLLYMCTRYGNRYIDLGTSRSAVICTHRIRRFIMDADGTSEF